MEFPFAINSLLTDTITKLDSSVTPARRNADGFVILFLSCVHMHTYSTSAFFSKSTIYLVEHW